MGVLSSRNGIFGQTGGRRVGRGACRWTKRPLSGGSTGGNLICCSKYWADKTSTNKRKRDAGLLKTVWRDDREDDSLTDPKCVIVREDEESQENQSNSVTVLYWFVNGLTKGSGEWISWIVVGNICRSITKKLFYEVQFVIEAGRNHRNKASIFCHRSNGSFLTVLLHTWRITDIQMSMV